MRPRMSLVADADQLSGYAYAASVAPHRAFDDVINPQFPTDLPDPLGSALVLHRRGACDDAEPLWRQAAELGDDIVGETVGEILLFRVPAQILQRQHSQHNSVFRWRFAGLQLHDGKQEPVAAARIGVDVPGLGGVLAESGPDLPDAIVQPLLVIDEGFPSPDVPADLLPGDDLSGTRDQESKGLEWLNLELHLDAALAQLAALDIQLEVFESELDGG